MVDDDPAARDLLRRHLARGGYRVETASGGAEAIRLAREFSPDAITLDVLMPQMDGWAVLAALKEDPVLAKIPVTILSIIEDRHIGFSLGASDYLTKPIERKNLLGVLDRLCGGTSGARILVVEDDQSARELIRHALSSRNWVVDEAENGFAGLDRLAESIPNVVLLDLMMPRMDGFEFLSRLRENEDWRDIRVVVLTAKSLTAEDRDRLSAGDVEKLIEKRGKELDALMSTLDEMFREEPAPANATEPV